MEEKNFFYPGDIVILKHLDSPEMLVVGREVRKFFKDNDKSRFKGIKCIWFSKDHKLQEGVFNTKDLLLKHDRG